MVLRPRVQGKDKPGTPDLPRPRRTATEVRAEKAKKAAEKEASATKTTAAKVRVDGLREALRREQGEGETRGPKLNPEIAATGQKQHKKAPMVSKSKGNLQSRDASPSSTGATEPAVNDTTVSV